MILLQLLKISSKRKVEALQEIAPEAFSGAQTGTFPVSSSSTMMDRKKKWGDHHAKDMTYKSLWTY